MLRVRWASGVTMMRQRPVGSSPCTRRGGELHARGADVVAEHRTELVVVHPPDERGGPAERRDAHHRVGGRPAGDLRRRAHRRVELLGARGVDERHRALLETVGGDELVGLVAQDVDERVADPDDVEPVAGAHVAHRPSGAAHAADGDRHADTLVGGGVVRWLRRPQPAAHGGGAPVERGALLERPAERVDDGVEVVVVELLAVAGAGGAGDVLVHQRAAEVVAPGEERLARAVEPGLGPRHLHVVDPSAVRDAPGRVHEQDLAHGGATTRALLEVDRAPHVHERQGNELGEPTGLLLQRTGARDVARHVHRALHGAEHDGDVRTQTDAVREAVRLQPLLGVHLVGADHRPHLVVEDLGRGARQRREPGLLGQREVLAERHPEPAGALGDLERGEAVHVDRRARPPSPPAPPRGSTRRRSRGGSRPAGTPRWRRTPPPRPPAAGSPRGRAGRACRAGSATSGPLEKAQNLQRNVQMFV